eukprot:662559-Rhodomonas_salina.1
MACARARERARGGDVEAGVGCGVGAGRYLFGLEPRHVRHLLLLRHHQPSPELHPRHRRRRGARGARGRGVRGQELRQGDALVRPPHGRRRSRRRLPPGLPPHLRAHLLFASGEVVVVGCRFVQQGGGVVLLWGGCEPEGVPGGAQQHAPLSSLVLALACLSRASERIPGRDEEARMVGGEWFGERGRVGLG